ncbi:hypothetical protein GCM10009555_084580 [Acrocarpospora macrocephala]|uniref:Putative restriction endonuclease domain-containing protein n=1 Tax=Acrocarpospora macrocephala TaxID=150177 RepID=A0A5M3WXM2_9ACTN|nr:Uma2 family endonuclease [Acrocarpospora macrocephala]GES14215.1 hypothetical protein Amac_078120 [Acrocarpospora macrocephala]
MSVAYDDRDHSYNHGPYTIADLDRMPQDERYELVNGWILWSPWPSIRHDHVVRALRSFFERAIANVDADFYVSGPLDVFTVAGIRVPDVGIVDGAAARLSIQREERAHQGLDVRLVVEVISRDSGSERTGRYEKPSEYAASGISHYWIVDLEPKVSITLYSLLPAHGVYRRVDRVFAGTVLKVDDPLPIEFDPGVLLDLG